MLKKIKRILQEKKETLITFAQELKDVEKNYKDLSPKFVFRLLRCGTALHTARLLFPLLPERLHTVSAGYLLQSGLRLQQKIIFITCVILPQNLSCVYTIRSTSLP